MNDCAWGEASPEMKAYHDTEWGVPVHEDNRQFEHLMLEVMQCGLSWALVLHRREVLRACFDGFDVARVAAYGEAEVERILATPGMIRSRRKIEAVIHNARCFQQMQAEFGSFSTWLWQRCGGKTICYIGHDRQGFPAKNALSEEISAELKKRGFRYVGAVTVYSHLQACGLINDHGAACPCYARINAAYPTVRRRRRGEPT